MVVAAAVVVIAAGIGGLRAPTTHANPSSIVVINDKVGAALMTAAGTSTTPAAFDTALTTNTGRATITGLVPFATIQTASGSQISQSPAVAGNTFILVLSDGSGSAIMVNGRGLVCSPACDNVATQAPDATDHYAVWQVTGTGTHSVGDSVTVTAVQDSVSLDSSANKVVGQAHDVALSVLNSQTTLGAGATTCTKSQATGPTTATAMVVYTDINGNTLVGYNPTLSSSSASTLAVGSSGTFPQGSSGALLTLVNSDTNVGAEDAICGNASGTATLTATTSSTANEITGITGTVTRTASITVTGVPSAVALTASPASIPCNGTATSTVTAKVTDSAGNNVADGTAVTFSVAALGTANPINAKTAGGAASSTITPLSATTAGVTVVVTSGNVSSSILVNCNLAAATPTGPVASPTAPTGTISGPNTGTGGYLGQDGSAGFPMWAILALALGSFLLIGGGVVVRRTGSK